MPTSTSAPERPMSCNHPVGGLDGMNKVAGLSWWVVGALVVIVAVSLMLANR